MTVVSYPLGTPRDAVNRGGDCRARDLSQGRNVHGGHVFAATTDCQINNGLLRLTVGVSGTVPSLTVEARRGRVTVGDVYEDTYTDLYGGEIGTPEWLELGTVTLFYSAGTALLTAVRLVRVNPEAVTIRLVSPLIADVFVTLHRGERMARIQHGSSRAPLVNAFRRIQWTDTPSPVGYASDGRVQETEAAFDGFHRWLGLFDAGTEDAATFMLTADTATTAEFGFGVGTQAVGDTPLDHHRQLGNASRPELAVA